MFVKQYQLILVVDGDTNNGAVGAWKPSLKAKASISIEKPLLLNKQHIKHLPHY